ncbi:MAG TPA: alpha-amylase family glycosyl hydrolase [Dinghuibacter sp.]|uniref:alpha-amylase family glycosyl hydrolase n=1 Tax=Dinghuibacter sp. TaxID=2024697 RepID=UPI002D095546|nr:alpha-amylase family glycosyl hydrolase [Dinghuibacter sp.]HTJ10695.1 alpha-amylase family glycosyl hydrolase [Dinghuibacter sp.]
MKRTFASVLLLLCGAFTTQAQLLTETPSFPTDTSTVTITVDCTLGNQGLLNYTPTTDVYVHIGLITSASANSGDWKYAPFTWGTTNAAAQATYIGNNKYTYTIHNIRSFFGVPAGETIYQVAILFRNGSGSQAQRNSSGDDMYQPVYGAALAGKFSAPPFQPEYTPVLQPISPTVGSQIPVTFITNGSAALQIEYNGTTVATQASGTSVSDNITIGAPGAQQIIASATNGGSSIADTINFFVSGATTIAPLPAGAKEGINYLPGDTSALLVLYAPLKHKVVVVGDFNNWIQGTAYQMNETPDSSYYWLQINGLKSGTEYAYQYVIDDSLQLSDYNTEKVLDKSVDPGIPASTYPGLKTFPAGAKGTLASVLQTGQTPYTWQVTNFQRPDKKGLMIYELWLADFTSAGNWQSLIDTLGYLKRLGVNAVEVEPVCNFEGSLSWGYNPNFYFAPDKVYGTATDFKRFIDACHAQGMAVIMDMVMNHSFGSSPMVQMYWNSALQIPAANSPWFNQYPTHADNVGYQFNHESPATIAFTKRVLSYWLTNYHIDGYRWDLAKGFTQTRTCDATGNNCDVNAWGVYDSSRVRTWDTINNQMQAASSGSYCILEMFAANNEQIAETNAGMMVWQNMNYNYNQATMGYSTGWDLSGGIYSALNYPNPGLVVYQESHDEERLQYQNETYGNGSGSYNVKDTATGLKRCAAATCFWAMTPGPKMLTEFGELGFDYSINWCTNNTVDPTGGCRLTPKPIVWNYLQDTSRKKLHDVYAAMMQLRGKYSDLATASCTYSLASNFKTLQLAAPDLSVVVVGNFDVTAVTGSVAFPTEATWYEYFTGSTIQATGSPQSLTLQPGEYRVYLNQNLSLTTPVTSVSNRDDSLLVKVVPDPAVSDAQVQYTIPRAGNATLSVFSMTGQQLGVLNLGYLTPHSEQVALASITGSAFLAPGVYWVRLGVGDRYNICPFVKQ